ncbi:MAG: type II/IV secretion system protein, partial [Kiritimatiellae bacterium]|nr:type II/IV secretion system protein [Kiritimatiellia bacterium]
MTASPSAFTLDPAPLDLDGVALDPSQAVRLPSALATRRLLLPLSDFGGALHVACATPPDPALAALLLRQTRAERLVFHRADPGALRRALMKVYGSSPAAAPAASATPSAAPDDAVALADEIFRAARLRRASDIHFDPGRDGLSVRFRVDGRLEPYRVFPPAVGPSLTSRVKVLAGMDIAERRAPQDGGFMLPPLPGDPRSGLDVRTATLPVRHGERVTLRLLAAERDDLTLGRLGMDPGQLAVVERLLEAPHGLFLLTGPTGSGKTTTLYAVIRRLLQLHEVNVLTVEDPVECEIPGVAQAEVDSADKVSFQKALRSLLRHDPDVVMIGEIRDAESLDTAVKASLTGHLVLSTLHTNDALGAVVRMADMGLAPHLIAATLRIAIAQRLARRLCPHCRVPYVLSDSEAALLGRPELAGRTAYRPGGCLACAGRGTRGRIGLFEL